MLSLVRVFYTGARSFAQEVDTYRLARSLPSLSLAVSLAPSCRRRRGRVTCKLQIEISENAIVKVDEIQKPIMGGSWITKTDFGRLEIKIVPYWTGE